MPSDRWRRAASAALFVVALVAGQGLQGAEVIERILAVVDGRPLMLSEVQLLQRVRGIDEPAAVEALIDERLMLREASRLAQAAVAQDEEDRAYASLLALHPAGTQDIPEAELRRLARRQTAILKYVDFRFRPQVRVAESEVREVYEVEQDGRGGPPAYETVAAEIRARLTARRLDERIEAWVRELRSSAEIRYNR